MYSLYASVIFFWILPMTILWRLYKLQILDNMQRNRIFPLERSNFMSSVALRNIPGMYLTSRATVKVALKTVPFQKKVIFAFNNVIFWKTIFLVIEAVLCPQMNPLIIHRTHRVIFIFEIYNCPQAQSHGWTHLNTKACSTRPNTEFASQGLPTLPKFFIAKPAYKWCHWIDSLLNSPQPACETHIQRQYSNIPIVRQTLG